MASRVTASREPQSPNLAQLDAEELRSMVAALRSEISSLTSLSHFMQRQTEREKAALARELHDSLGGLLTPAKMDLAWLEARLGSDPQYAPRLKRLSDLIDEGIDLKRRIIEGLHPSLLDHLGLASALTWYVQDACRDSGVACAIRIPEDLGRLAPDLEITVYRLAQQIVRNVVQHSRARRLEFDLGRKDGGLRLEVRDDGAGIADLVAALRSHGFGSMVQRVKSVNGTFEIDSAPGKGTRVEVFVPL
jgi:signal transduction histidine kinase